MGGSSSDMTSLCASANLDNMVYDALNAVSTITWWNFVMAWCPSSSRRERRLQDTTQTVSYQLQFASVSLANTFGDDVGDSVNKETIAIAFIEAAANLNITVTGVTVNDATITDNTEIVFGNCGFHGFTHFSLNEHIWPIFAEAVQPLRALSQCGGAVQSRNSHSSRLSTPFGWCRC